MPEPIEFYFDFASPYSYLAAFRIDDIAARHGREVAWKPMMLGVAFKKVGTAPLTAYPLKGDYSRRDFQRTARIMGIVLDLPDGFPHNTLAAARAYYWAEDNDPEKASNKAKELAMALFRAYFAEGRDIGQAEVVGDIAAKVGLDAEAVLEGIQDPAIKEKVKAVTNDAIDNRGVFGAPFFFVDGEPFWGCDRIDQLDHWLETGGW